MAHAIKSEDLNDGNGTAAAGPSTAAAEAALKAKLSRKRTKTGCLTCRKRRIKCDESRPACRNCVKSKRHCEGYNQRVVFKAPTFDYRSTPGGAHITFQAGPVPGPANAFPDSDGNGVDPHVYAQPSLPQHEVYETLFDHRTQQYVTVARPPHQVPIHNGLPILAQHGHPLQAQSPAAMQIPPGQAFGAPINHMNGASVIPCTGSFGAPERASAGQVAQTAPFHMANGIHPPGSEFPGQLGSGMPPGSGNLAQGSFAATSSQQSTPWDPFNHLPAGAVNGISNDHRPTHEHISPTAGQSSQSLNPPETPITVSQQQWTTTTYIPRPELSQPIDYQPTVIPVGCTEMTPPISVAPMSAASEHITPEFFDQGRYTQSYTTPTHVLSAAAVETQDDDYYDIASDEEMDTEDSPVIIDQGPRRQRILGRILAMNQITVRELEMRRYDTFLYDGILDHYRVEQVANPLRNAATARVFAHFISATGPGLSIFERHPRNTSVLFTESIPFSQQGLWTYTMPMAALRNQGLLHAMLALASLHIARLQGASETPSMQHYAWALKRIHHCVGHPSKRLKLTTIAASMLLGFYEVMTADHMKWNMHLAGSKQLFVEIDFVRMTRKFRRMKAERFARSQSGLSRQSGEGQYSLQDALLDQVHDVDERIISQIIGREVRYDDHGHVEAPQTPIEPDLDLSRFEILKDLYWWYCKQDAYQSIVSGNPLLMDFNRWANCPPRAPLGKADAVYGSFDHLVLLLGRIADFSARDRERKVKQVEVNGGHWRPAPGMNVSRPPQGSQPPTPVSANHAYPPGSGFPGNPQTLVQGPPPPVPQFYGMAPPPRVNVQMPSSYNPMHSIPTPQSAQPPDLLDEDLHAATQAAMEEYGRVRGALHTFKMSLGEAFEPLTSEYHAQDDTPFGTALCYRSYDIGCLWAVYNMAVIIAIRSHPHMPPAMHMAAAVAAQETASYANEIGRISAGIVPGPPDQPLNPSLGSALCESCMPSFFAAVQYQNAEQRRDTVRRIFSIAHRTGWGSAELIANGCETAWVKAAAAGRGPPYTRVGRQPHSDDPRLNGSWERLDPNSVPNETDDSDRRLVKQKPVARLNWAIGVMGVEEDLEKSGLVNGR